MEEPIVVLVCQMRSNAIRAFLFVPTLPLTKQAQPTAHQYKYIAELPVSAILGRCANDLLCHFLVAAVYSTLDTFISTWHLHQSVLCLLFWRHSPFHRRHTTVFFFFTQPSFQLHHINYCLLFNCWWSLPAVVWRCSQSIIDRYPRQGYLNSLRLAWFTFPRHGLMCIAIKNAPSIRCCSMEVDHWLVWSH